MTQIATPPPSPDEEIRRKLADSIKEYSNGNGHHKAEDSEQEEIDQDKTTADPGAGETSGTFDMFNDIKAETEQDQKRKDEAGPGTGPGTGGKNKNPFDEMGPDHDVKEEEIRNEENINLTEANARVSLYITTLDFSISLACCGIKRDFSLESQVKYRIHTWRKKAIQIPWVRYVMIPKKRSHPALALGLAIFAGTLPVLGMAYMDKLHEEKIKQDPAYAKKNPEPPPAQADTRQDHPNENRRSPFETEGEFVEYEEVKENDLKNDSNTQQKKTVPNDSYKKRGRHKETCPKHYNKKSKEPCNCK